MGYTFFIFSFFSFFMLVYRIFIVYLQHDLMSDKVQLIISYQGTLSSRTRQVGCE